MSYPNRHGRQAAGTRGRPLSIRAGKHEYWCLHVTGYGSHELERRVQETKVRPPCFTKTVLRPGRCCSLTTTCPRTHSVESVEEAQFSCVHRALPRTFGDQDNAMS